MNKGQSRKGSAIETVLSTAIGLGVAILTQIAVFPLFAIEVTFGQNLTIAMIFTLVSIIRGFFVRRFFNWLHKLGYFVAL